MGYRKVYKGTPNWSEHLCPTCRYGHAWTEGGQERLRCRAHFDDAYHIGGLVSQCSEYQDRRVPDLHDYKEIAWTLETKGGRIVGFAAPKRREED